MAFWSGQRLLIEGKSRGIVSDYDEGQVDCSAYTLTMGREAYVTPDHGDSLKDSKKVTLSRPKAKQSGGKQVRFGGGSVVIPAGQFAFLLTEQSVNIPDDAMGFISLRTGIKFRGLINVSGFHVDPGFCGRLIYSVYNAGPSPITVARGDDLFLLWIADLSGDVNLDYTKRGADEQLEIPSSLISTVARENHSLQALSEKIDGLAKKVSFIRNITIGASGALGAVAAVAAVLALWPSAPKSEPPDSHLTANDKENSGDSAKADGAEEASKNQNAAKKIEGN